MIEFLSILFGGGIVTLVQFLIKRHDDKKDKKSGVLSAISALAEQVKRIDGKLESQAAVTARVRILRFADEMREGRRHSKDAWDQVLTDIDGYEAYCEAHPEFRNNMTLATVRFIKETYAERLERNDFL